MKVDARLDVSWLRERPLRDILAVLDRDGEEARVVGGAVRNALLGIPHGDIDIATTAEPREVIRRAQAAGFKTVPTGIDHGTVTIVANGSPYEVTTLREDVETFGRHATVRFGRDWKRDAERRDFTMNALFAAADGTVHDYVGGLADIEKRHVRFIGDASKRIAEDYLRILRFFRFHAYYGAGEPDAAGLAACIAARGGLAQLSRERIRMELMKLLLAPRAPAAFAAMAQAGILADVLGGEAHLASFEAMTKVEAVCGFAPDATRRLGALGAASVADADQLWQRLRLSNAEHATLTAMTDGWRNVSPQTGEAAARVLIYKIGPEHFANRALLAWSRSNASADDTAWRDLVTLPQRWSAPAFPLRAADFMERGVEKGPSLGAALARAEAVWVALDFPMDRKALNLILNESLGG